MQLITLKIDDSKYHFVDFEGNENPQQQYIFNNNNVAEKRIIKFAPFDNYNTREGVTFQTNIEKSRCYIAEIELSEGAATENVDRPCIKILLSAERPKNQTINNNRLRLEDNGQLSLRANRNRSTIISVEVVYETESHKFTLIYANREKIADAVLDYGSEASQLLVCSRDRTIRLSNILNLFSEIKAVNINGDQFQNVPDDDIAQYSENNRKLFLSKFMVKKSIEEQFLDDEQREVKLGDFLKFIFKKGDIDALQDDYTILPNMKIMNSGIDDIEINIRENPEDNGFNTDLQELGEDMCHRMSINVFIFQALKQVWQNNRGRRENRVEYVSFSVLMPNNYSYVDISKRLKYLRIDIQQILDVFHDDFNFIKGFEVSAVSESDASLIGAYETSTERIGEDYRFNGGRYLILDAGKGTFDFSIMKYNIRERYFHNLCKSGIIGAGNAISYAILLDIIDGIIVKDDDIATHHRNIEAFISNIILGNSDDGKGNEGGDPSRLLELMNAIDLYKKGGRKDKHNLTTRIATDGLYINGLINIINDEFITPERSLANHRFTDIMIEKIVNSIFSQIDKVNVYRDNNGNINDEINYYVCAGRGFLYQPLKDAIVRKIEERFPMCHEVVYIEDNNNVTPKNVCLFISNAINNGRYNSNVIGTPFIINDPNNDEKDASRQKPKRGFLSQLGQQFMQLVSKEEAVDMSATLMPTYQTYMFNGKEKQVDEMVNGYNFNNKNNTVSRINIGGVELDLARTIPQNSDIDVFYNGEEYIIRSNGEIYNINRGTNTEGQLVFESLFPSVQDYPNDYTSFFNPNDFDMEEDVVEDVVEDDVIESIAMPTPQIPDSGENKSATKSKPEPIVTDTPQSPQPDCDKGGSDDSKNSPFNMESLLGDIEEQKSKLNQ